MTHKRIGFACKFLHDDRSLTKRRLTEIEAEYNSKSTTVTWLEKQTTSNAEDKLWSVIKHNFKSSRKLLKYVSSLPKPRHMLRLSSDLLPMYTHEDFSYFYKQPDVLALCEKEFLRLGDFARKHDIRLSFHPGQFTVLASDRLQVVVNSIQEFEYHADMIRWMGYGNTFQDFKCNVHISGKKGWQGIVEILPRLSNVARNTITIENDEIVHGIDESMHLAEHVALVLDIHHHFVKTGEYIQPDDTRVRRIIDSWRGVRPTLHYSYSREEYVGHVKNNTLPNRELLLESGYKISKLRAHSEYYPNVAANNWALSFLEDFDIMCECKTKNLGSAQLYQWAVATKMIDKKT